MNQLISYYVVYIKGALVRYTWALSIQKFDVMHAFWTMGKSKCLICYRDYFRVFNIFYMREFKLFMDYDGIIKHVNTT